MQELELQAYNTEAAAHQTKVTVLHSTTRCVLTAGPANDMFKADGPRTASIIIHQCRHLEEAKTRDILGTTTKSQNRKRYGAPDTPIQA